jgi:hypothetical protein
VPFEVEVGVKLVNRRGLGEHLGACMEHQRETFGRRSCRARRAPRARCRTGLGFSGLETDVVAWQSLRGLE